MRVQPSRARKHTQTEEPASAAGDRHSDAEGPR